MELTEYEECLSLAHPDHREDYFKFCIYRKEKGKTRVEKVHSYGQSKNKKRKDPAANTHPCRPDECDTCPFPPCSEEEKRRYTGQ